MAKKINLDPERTFAEMTILPGLTEKNCSIQDVNLETRIGSLDLRLPLMSAAMQSVTGYELALALGKEGGIGILPVRLPLKDQLDIVRQLKAYTPGFVDDPVTLRETARVEEALNVMHSHGHTTIPVCDRNNVFLGMFTHEHYLNLSVPPSANITKAMIPLRDDAVLSDRNLGITIKEATDRMRERGTKYLVVLDDEGRLAQIAFKKDAEYIPVGVALSTHEDWVDRFEANREAGVDLFVIDTSDAYSEFAHDVIEAYKASGVETPLVAGNVVTYEGAMYLFDAGVDAVKVGMSSGSICTTQQQKGVGRAPVSALIDVDRARKDYVHKSGRDVAVIADGGISTGASIAIGLAIADVVMMGNYFNRFFEAAGHKFDKSGRHTTLDSEIAEVETFGEGSDRARNLDRYGHSDQRTFFAEGVASTVPYAGRMKPTLKADLLRVRAAMVNAGCKTLAEFREQAVLTVLSPYAADTVSRTHDINPP